MLLKYNNIIYYKYYFNTGYYFTQDLLLRSETFEPSYPLLNVYTLYKKCMDLSRIIELSIPEQSIYAINSIVSNEYKTFLESLDANGII